MGPISKSDLGIFFLAAVGVCLLLFITQRGIGLNAGGSVSYIDASRHLIKGQGLVTVLGSSNVNLLTHYPPFYSILLSVGGLLGVDPVVTARWLNAVLFGGNIFLVGWMLNVCTRSFGISALGSLLMLTSVDMLKVHAQALSEALFIFLLLLGILLLAIYLEKSKKILLLVSSFIISMAAVTKFGGIPIIISSIIGIIFLSPQKKDHQERMVDAIIFGTIGFIPLIIWMVTNHYYTSQYVDRLPAIHPLSCHQIITAGTKIENWLLLGGMSPYGFMIVSWGGFLIGLIWCHKIFKYNPSQGEYKQLPLLTGICIIVYALSLYISVSFLDASTDLNYRILSPLFALGLIFALYLLHHLYSVKEFQILRVVLVIAGVFFALFYLQRAIPWCIHTSQDGLGYASKKWRESKCIERIKNSPPDTLIYSNEPDAIYILTDRRTLNIPIKFDNHTLIANHDYLLKLKKMEEKLKDGKGILIYFENKKTYYPMERELENRLPLNMIAQYPDGTIYKVK